jgi:TldD protein
VKLLESIDAYARGKDARVRQVTANVAATWQVVEILRADGEIYRDIRPLVRLNVSVVAGDGDRQESAATASAAVKVFNGSSRPTHGKAPSTKPSGKALINLDAVPAPAG